MYYYVGESDRISFRIQLNITWNKQYKYVIPKQFMTILFTIYVKFRSANAYGGKHFSKTPHNRHPQ